MTLSPPSSWSELTFAQLLWIHTHGEVRQGEADINRRLRVFLYLTDLEMFGQSYYAVSDHDQTPYLDQPDLTIYQMSDFYRMIMHPVEVKSEKLKVKSEESLELRDESLEKPILNSQPSLSSPDSTLSSQPTLSSNLSTLSSQPTPPLIVLLRPIDHTRRPWYRRLFSILSSRFSIRRSHRPLPFGLPVKQLFDAVVHYTKFLDEPLTLTALPQDTIIIDGETYQLPQPLLSNLTYEQFNNCQHALNQFWRDIDNASRVNSNQSLELKDESLEKPILNSQNSLSSNLSTLSSQPSLSSKLSTLSSQTAFLAHILTPISTYDTHGNPVYEYSSRHADTLATRFAQENANPAKKRKGKPSLSSNLSTLISNLSTLSSQPSLSSNLSPLISNLFPLLYQQFQSSLLQFQTMFPHVFTSSGGKGSTENPIVSELGTLNAVMKYQGYTTQQEVYDTNALLVFKIIDSMTREAKEMEKANRRASHK